MQISQRQESIPILASSIVPAGKIIPDSRNRCDFDMRRAFLQPLSARSAKEALRPTCRQQLRIVVVVIPSNCGDSLRTVLAACANTRLVTRSYHSGKDGKLAAFPAFLFLAGSADDWMNQRSVLANITDGRM